MKKVVNIENFDVKKDNFLVVFYDISQRYGWFYEFIEELSHRFNVHLVTNILPLEPYESIVSCTSLDKNSELNLNIYPNDISLGVFEDIVQDLTKQFGEFRFVLDSPLRTTFYIELSEQLQKVKKMHYTLYEPNFWIDPPPIAYTSLKLWENNFYFMSPASIKWIERNVNRKINTSNIVGVPVHDIDTLLANGRIKEKHHSNESFKIIIPSRLEVTKMYVISALLDILQLLNEGFNLEITLIGQDGSLSNTIVDLINRSNLKKVVKKLPTQFPIDTDFWKEHDVAITMGTTALVTAAIGVPTIFALPNLPIMKNRNEILYEYIYNKGFLGIDFDLMVDIPSLDFDGKLKFTYYELLKRILQNELDLFSISSQSISYVENYISFLRASNIVDRLIRE